MFQKTRIRLTIVNSLVFILLIGILGSIIYSYTYKRIYNEVDQSIKMMAQYREKLDVKIPPRKRMENIQIGDPRVTRITWNGKIVKIEGDNRKFRSIFEENLESFSPEKLEELQDIEVQGRYFRAFSLQKDGEIVQIVRDITAEEGMLNTLFLIL
ncbi:sensor histidine kinase, partial [Bacillus sp. SS-TM]